MPKQVRLDDEVYEALKDLAVGFERPNQVLRRLLKLDCDDCVETP